MLVLFFIFDFLKFKMKLLSSFLKKTTKGCIIACIAFLFFECAYQFSVIDFYKAELIYLNNVEDLGSNKIDFLVFGDSFSADKNNYINILKKERTECSFINTSIPGTGIKQVNTFAKKKIEKYNPKNIIYQVYVGNDLLDIKHLSNWEKISVLRNLYWKVTDYFESGIYLNQKLKGFGKHDARDTNTLNKKFSIELYNARQKLLFNTDFNYLERTVFLENDFKERYYIWKKELLKFLNSIPKTSNVFIMFIPHCSQVNSLYLENMEKLGAKFDNRISFQEIAYPFFDFCTKDFKKFENVVFLNPLPFLRKQDSVNNRLYYQNDPHLNQNGHKELANYLNLKIFN